MLYRKEVLRARRRGKTKAAEGRHIALKVWAAMRILRRFTVAEITAVCELDSHTYVKRYAGQLAAGGFLRKTPGTGTTHYPVIFQLVRDTGPQAPSVIRKRTAMFDHNTETEYPLQ